MANTIQKKRREERFREYINNILINQELDCDEEWWNDAAAQRELEALAGAPGNYISDSGKMNMGGSQKLLFAVCREAGGEFMESVRKQTECLAGSAGAVKVQKVFFVGNMKNRIFLENNFPRNSVCILMQDYAEQTVKLKNLKRYEMMQEPPVSGKINLESVEGELRPAGERRAVSGLVCTVDLFQIVELYNLLGDQLFKYNVRVGMKEELDVDRAIRNTLEKEPECFWFKNNGITILAEHPDFRIRNAEELVLDVVEPGKEPRFSVINGAQTINTAARFFYETECELREGKTDREEAYRQSKKARVLLRLIHIPKQEEEKQSGEGITLAKEISVALNRQKPIKSEDIAFTAPFVEKLAAYLERRGGAGNGIFRLVRRGEKTDPGKQLDLVEFARARLACAGKPGNARSRGASEFLKFGTGGGDSFADRDIFVEEWQEADGPEEETVFLRHYSAVWYAHRIAQEYERCKSGIGGGEQIQNVIKNGKWYFTAFLIQMLNGIGLEDGEAGEDSSLDYTKFACDIDVILENIQYAVLDFAGMAVAYFDDKREKYGEMDSNFFKKNEPYEDMVRELSARRGLSAETAAQQKWLADCQNFAGRFGMNWFTGTEVPGEEGRAEQNQEFTEHVVLGQGKHSVKSGAQALAMVAEYVLTYYPPAEERLGEMENWITGDRKIAREGQGYFRGAPRLVNVNGKGYWIATSSNSETKCGQMRQLCKLADVPRNQIFWYKDSAEKAEFAW